MYSRYFILAGIALSVLSAHGGEIESSSTKAVPEFSLEIESSYDGSRFRTGTWEWSASVMLEKDDKWSMELGAHTYSDLKQSASLQDEAQGFLNLERTVWISEKEDAFLQISLEIAGPSTLSYRGMDFTLELDFEFECRENWWIGVAIGGTLATSPDPGNKVGYAFLDTWVTIDTSWLPNESDYVTIGVYASTQEDPQLGKSLSVEGVYGFDLTDSCAVEFGVGTEIATPYEQQGIYALGKLSWRWN
ncbi:hypothetical protein BH11VER1_BH11VER1_11640 [soil metagenome]